MSTLTREQQEQVRRGYCPHCEYGVFLPGPRGGLCQNKLCSVCLREYNVGPAVAEILHELCPAERLAEIYGIRLAT